MSRPQRPARRKPFNMLFAHGGHDAPGSRVCAICGQPVCYLRPHRRCETEAQKLAITPGDRKRSGKKP